MNFKQAVEMTYSADRLEREADELEHSGQRTTALHYRCVAGHKRRLVRAFMETFFTDRTILRALETAGNTQTARR